MSDIHIKTLQLTKTDKMRFFFIFGFPDTWPRNETIHKNVKIDIVFFKWLKLSEELTGFEKCESFSTLLKSFKNAPYPLWTTSPLYKLFYELRKLHCILNSFILYNSYSATRTRGHTGHYTLLKFLILTRNSFLEFYLCCNRWML